MSPPRLSWIEIEKLRIGLSKQWSELLVWALAYRDIGQRVSALHSDQHAYYCILNADLPGLPRPDVERITRLLLWKSEDTPNMKNLSFLNSKADRKQFLIALGAFRILCALSPTQNSARIRITRKKGTLNFSARLPKSKEHSGNIEISFLRADQRKELLETISGIRVTFALRSRSRPSR
jgi:exopolyphosphatase/pppGpp-phosphohydrolase